MDLVFTEPPLSETPLRAAIRDAHRFDETEADARILAAAAMPAETRDRIAANARRLVEAVRRERLGKGGLDAFLHEYALSSPEGVALMCLAEALLRIPEADAERYRVAYEHAIAAIGKAAAGRPVHEAPGISVKLSALHPRYEMAQRQRVMRELLPTLLGLARHARDAGIGFTIDAEEADRLELSLDLVEALALAPDLTGWDGLGLAVQAYQKRALPLIDWLARSARRARPRLMVRP